MALFLRERGIWLGMVILIMALICLAQIGISYTMTFGALRHSAPLDGSSGVTILVALRIAILVVLIALWALKCKRAVFRCIVIANALFTSALFIHTVVLIAVLAGSSSLAVDALILDVTLMAVSNVLIFSVWYWIIDPPGVEEIPRADEPWEFLFPQRASSLPHYEAWVPHYVDYLFVAFTTSLAFGPTDTSPLSRRAKTLMLLQSAISIITLTGIAGSVINILAGGR